MKILVTGGQGMLGRTMAQSYSAKGHTVIPVDLQDFDITDFKATLLAVKNADPDVVIHCAAMTAVDDCESNADMAYKVNAIGSASVANAARSCGAKLVAISTDYVFGELVNRPRHEWDIPQPSSVYGQSKYAGECAVRTHCPEHIIARIAWLYGMGGPSFVHTMLRLGAQGGEPLKVVDDQIGNPTSCRAVAEGVLRLLEHGAVGTYHLTCEGETSWYGFTKEIFRLAGLTREVVPCTSAEFPRPAPRPTDSRLENRALRLCGLPVLPQWGEEIARFLQDGV